MYRLGLHNMLKCVTLKEGPCLWCRYSLDEFHCRRLLSFRVVFIISLAGNKGRSFSNPFQLQKLKNTFECRFKVLLVVFIVQKVRWNILLFGDQECQVMPLRIPEELGMAGHTVEI